MLGWSFFGVHTLLTKVNNNINNNNIIIVVVVVVFLFTEMTFIHVFIFIILTGALVHI